MILDFRDFIVVYVFLKGGGFYYLVFRKWWVFYYIGEKLLILGEIKRKFSEDIYYVKVKKFIK